MNGRPAGREAPFLRLSPCEGAQGEGKRGGGEGRCCFGLFCEGSGLAQAMERGEERKKVFRALAQGQMRVMFVSDP